MKYKTLILDFDGVLTDDLVHTATNGNEFVTCSKRDSFGLAMIMDEGCVPYVITYETAGYVNYRCKKLGILYTKGCVNKKLGVENWLRRIKVKPEEAIYIGNDVNDLPAFETGVIAVAVADADPDVLSKADFVTHCRGGRGAVREVCDAILEGDLDSYLHNTR